MSKDISTTSCCWNVRILICQHLGVRVAHVSTHDMKKFNQNTIIVAQGVVFVAFLLRLAGSTLSDAR